MEKETILQEYWIRYIKYWATEVREVTTPPTEDGFWVWYALNVFDRDIHEEDLIIE